MTLRSTTDLSDVRHRVDGLHAAATTTQAASMPSRLGILAAPDMGDGRDPARKPIEVLRDHYDRGSEAYLNGAICRIEYAHIVEQIDHMLSALVAPEIRVAASGAGLPAPQRGRNGTGKKKGRGKPGIDANSDVGFVAIVQHMHSRLARLNRSAGEDVAALC